MLKLRNSSLPILILLLVSFFALTVSGEVPDQKERVKLKNPTSKELRDLCNYKSLEMLTIKGNVPGKLPGCLRNLTKLRVLELVDVNANLDFSSIVEWNALEELSLKHIAISKLPDFILHINQLKNLDLTGTKIETLPEGLEFLERIDMRMIELNRQQQDAIRQQYPGMNILFSSPCQCG